MRLPLALLCPALLALGCESGTPSSGRDSPNAARDSDPGSAPVQARDDDLAVEAPQLDPELEGMKAHIQAWVSQLGRDIAAVDARKSASPDDILGVMAQTLPSGGMRSLAPFLAQRGVADPRLRELMAQKTQAMTNLINGALLKEMREHGPAMTRLSERVAESISARGLAPDPALAPMLALEAMKARSLDESFVLAQLPEFMARAGD